MRIDQATISLQPRNTLHCLDLAVCFYGRHLVTILGLWLLVTVPACGLVYELAAHSEYDLRMALFVGYFATFPLGTLLMSGAAPNAFGEPFDLTGGEGTGDGRSFETTRAFLNFAAIVLTAVLLVFNFDLEFARSFAQQENTRLAVLGTLTGVLAFRSVLFLESFHRLTKNSLQLFLFGFVRKCVICLGPAVCLFAGGGWKFLGLILCLLSCPFAIRTGFILEKHFLAELDGKLHSRNTKELLKDETANLFFKGNGIVIFCGLLAFVMFITLDVVSMLLFRFPILIGRIGQSLGPAESYENGLIVYGEIVEDVYYLLTSDPRVLTALVATGLLVYPIARLAWFFCYIDLRVCRDCWDIELQFAHEAERIRQTA
ncbi:MAG: hypothetical protein IH899_12185 [Planctomycetes bacterium]|nr:hypothetical protein [Planctomycetota bacterium]